MLGIAQITLLCVSETNYIKTLQTETLTSVYIQLRN